MFLSLVPLTSHHLAPTITNQSVQHATILMNAVPGSATTINAFTVLLVLTISAPRSQNVSLVLPIMNADKESVGVENVRTEVIPLFVAVSFRNVQLVTPTSSALPRNVGVTSVYTIPLHPDISVCIPIIDTAVKVVIEMGKTVVTLPMDNCVSMHAMMI